MITFWNMFREEGKVDWKLFYQIKTAKILHKNDFSNQKIMELLEVDEIFIRDIIEDAEEWQEMIMGKFEKRTHSKESKVETK